MTDSSNLSPLSIKEMLDRVQLGEILDQALEGFQVIDADWRYVYANNALAAQGKYTKEQLIGHTMMELYPGIETTPLFAKMQEVMNNKTSVRFENEFTFPDGSIGWFQLYIHPWQNGIMIFSVDISERKRLEQGLIKQVEELQQLENSRSTPERITEIKNSLDALVKSANAVVE